MDKKAFLDSFDTYHIEENREHFVCKLVTKYSNGMEIPMLTIYISKALLAYAIKEYRYQGKGICENFPLYSLRLEKEDLKVYDYLAKYFKTTKEILLMSYYYYKDNFEDEYNKLTGSVEDRCKNYYIFDKYRLE